MLKRFRKVNDGKRLRDIPVECRASRLEVSREIPMSDVSLIDSCDKGGEARRLCESLGVENVVAAFPMPMGLAEHFTVNGREIPAVPMVTEERTVVAAASKAAKLVSNDGFRVGVGRQIARAQVLMEIPDPASYVESLPTGSEAAATFGELKAHLERDGMPFRKHGGGEILAVDRDFLKWDGRCFAQLTLAVTTGEAMGARGVTAYAKALGALLERQRDWKPRSWICLNDNPARIVRARGTWNSSSVGPETVRRVLDNQSWAEKSASRAVTHNKGVMNGIDAVAIATGQDVRAIEAGAWADAHREGRCRPLTRYDELYGGVIGSLHVQLTVGAVGGATRHPFASFSRRLMGAETSAELMAVMGAVGLAQNFAALAWALDT